MCQPNFGTKVTANRNFNRMFTQTAKIENKLRLRRLFATQNAIERYKSLQKTNCRTLLLSRSCLMICSLKQFGDRMSIFGGLILTINSYWRIIAYGDTTQTVIMI